jgi:Antitoxin SocA-like, Panacea domain
MTTFRPDSAKLRELVLYIATKSEGDPSFGATKLNKILFFCDFLAYRALGNPITGQRYQKLPQGPAPRGLVPVVEEMGRAGDCALVERDHFGYRQKRLVPLRAPHLSLFSAEEIDLVTGVIAELWSDSASSVSELSHQFIGWKAVEAGEDIDYPTVFVGDPDRPLDDDEIEYGQQVWAEYRGA